MAASSPEGEGEGPGWRELLGVSTAAEEGGEEEEADEAVAAARPSPALDRPWYIMSRQTPRVLALYLVYLSIYRADRN